MFPSIALCGFLLAGFTAPYVASQPADARFPESRIQSVVEEGRMTSSQVDTFVGALFSGHEAPRARYGVDVAVLQIYTRYPNGRLTRTRVQVFVPVTEDPETVYLFAPGSTGLIGVCRASREHEAGIVWGRYRAHVLAFAGQGFIGVLPDYMGFEDDALIQPYFHAESEARVVFDALHAVDEWIRPTLPGGLAPLRRVAAGYSQGGHAVLAAADRNALLGGSLYLHGVIGYGPTAEIEPLLELYPSLGPMVVMSFYAVYGRPSVDPHEIFLARWAEELEYDTTRQCVGGIQRYYPSSPEALFDPIFLESMRTGRLDQTHPVIARIFEANRTGLARHGVPTLILQGTNDVVVSRATQDRYVEELRRRGTPVDYRVYQGARHDTRQIAFPDVVAWTRSLRSSRPAPPR